MENSKENNWKTKDLGEGYMLRYRDDPSLEFITGATNISVAVKDQCQFSCRTCYSKSLHKGEYNVDPLAYQKLLELTMAVKVGLTFGEPTLHPQLDELVGMTIEQRINLEVDTNGVDIKKLAHLIYRFRDNSLYLDVRLSIDADHEEQHSLRGSDLIETAKQLRTWAKHHNNDLYFTWRRLNEKDDFVERATSALGIDMPTFMGIDDTEPWYLQGSEDNLRHFQRPVPDHIYFGLDGYLYDNNFDFNRANVENAIGQIVKR